VTRALRPGGIIEGDALATLGPADDPAAREVIAG